MTNRPDPYVWGGEGTPPDALYEAVTTCVVCGQRGAPIDTLSHELDQHASERGAVVWQGPRKRFHLRHETRRIEPTVADLAQWVSRVGAS